LISLETALVRLGLSLVLGALVGLEREQGERAAGIRTHTLVALGSCLIMIVSAFGFADILGTPAVVLDPSRIAAQVVSGIGFLGAGTILLRKEIIKGLTTAAAIWVVAAIGLACGAGLLLEAIAVTIFTLVVLRVLQPLRDRLRRTSASYSLRIDATVADAPLIARMATVCAHKGVRIESVQVQTGRSGDRMNVECSASDASHLTQAVAILRTIPQIQQVHLTLRRVDITHLSLSALNGDHLVKEGEEGHGPGRDR
jgi:putative Mg2+ transporter-C (MgtC) family protein